MTGFTGSGRLRLSLDLFEPVVERGRLQPRGFDLGVPVIRVLLHSFPDLPPLEFQVFLLAAGDEGLPGGLLQAGANQISPRGLRPSVFELPEVLPSLRQMPKVEPQVV